ncbi:glycosyl transferase [Pseudonocardia sulfidoxydans NBRC 16205]|uniref:Glycosyl transferase n=2 Tax=Pseudonocardia sulfidoxydans TaxID=54011 RepID=A0A511DK01_9PSEU|nr:glycosyltransferase [Pseudonocardia sulfidoxydans]GEL24757.1 glycosyl transferase [Pseudonocardia sulfidoxydans NBRC 16205]
MIGGRADGRGQGVRVLIAALGSRGDVVGFVGLGRRLAADGLDVTVAANPEFADDVHAGGIGFAPLAGDARTISDLPSGWRTSPRALAAQADALTSYLESTADDLVDAAQHADLLLCNVTAMFGVDVAEGLGIPSAGLFSQPIEPTREFPPMLLHTARSLGGVGNLLAGRVALRSAVPFHRASARVRSRLGLPRRSAAATARALERQRWRVWHGWSPHVLPRPADWRPGLDVVGYWHPVVPDDWTPAPELATFLDDGPAPVYLGFGSMGHGRGAELSAIVADVVGRTGIRAVVHRGWAGLEVSSDRVCLVDHVPHAWLFPRMAAVVHHGGAGTAGAAFTAGVPVVTVPVYADQPLWAARARALGVGPEPLPQARLTAAALAERITDATTRPEFRRTAARLAAAIVDDDGAGAVAAALADHGDRGDRGGQRS